MDQSNICEIHQQPLVFFDNKSKKSLCLSCQQPISEFHQTQFQNKFKSSEQCLKILKQLHEGLKLHKQQILQSIDQLLMIVQKFIKNIDEQQAILNDQFYQQSTSKCKLQNESQSNFLNIFIEDRNKLQQEFNELIVVSKLDKLAETMKNINAIQDGEECEEKKIKLEQQIDKKNNDNNQAQSNLIVDVKFDYQLIQQPTYKQEKQSIAISFNKDSTLMIAGCDNLINVFEFQQDKLKEIQSLNDHAKRVFCILIMKKSNHFITASEDGVMIIWEQNLNFFQWQSIQVLNAHIGYIYSITTNQNEDMLISGSQDKTIKLQKRERNT